MSQQAFERGDWQAVIESHPLESHDPAEWLRYGAALLHTIEPGPEQGRQQQQAALAFVQAQKEGASAEAVAAAQQLAVLRGLKESLVVAGCEQVAQTAEERCAGLQSWQNLRLQVCEALGRGEWQAGQALIREWINGQETCTLAGVDGPISTELLLNACSRADQRLPMLWLVESRSLPRSGHHFLKSLLEQAWGEDFSYCEGYQEPGCCQASPCRVAAYWHFAREHQRPHLRLLKSHDFTLSDATFEPPEGMLRLIQVRRPFDLLVSWLELEQLALNRALLKNASLVVERVFLYHEPEVLEEAWRLINEAGTVMTAEQVQQWLAEKVRYVVGFLNKWLPQARPLSLDQPIRGGNVLLRYEDLGQCNQLLKALGRHDLDEAMLPAFAPRHRQVMERRAARVTELIETIKLVLLEADAEVLSAVPAMARLYPENLNLHR
jgi:hypothetical protein